MNIFFSPAQVTFFRSMMEKWIRMWIPNYTNRGLWLPMMGYMKRLHYFHSYSTMGLIAGKKRATSHIDFFFQTHKNAEVHLPTLFPAALKDEVYFLPSLRGFIQPRSCWGLRCTTGAQHSRGPIWNDIGLHKCHCLIGLMKSNVCPARTSWGLFLHQGGGAASVSLYTVFI